MRTLKHFLYKIQDEKILCDLVMDDMIIVIDSAESSKERHSMTYMETTMVASKIEICFLTSLEFSLAFPGNRFAIKLENRDRPSYL